MFIYDLKSAYYLSDASSIEFYCAHVENYVVIVYTTITIWEVIDSELVFLYMIPFNFPDCPFPLRDPHSIDKSPDVSIFRDYLHKITNGKYSIDKLEYSQFQKRHMPKNVLGYHDRISEILWTTFDKISVIRALDDERGVSYGTQLVKMVFLKEAPLEKIESLCKFIDYDYEHMTGKNTSLDEFIIDNIERRVE